MAERIPETPEGQRLRAEMTPERWAKVSEDAVARAEVVEGVASRRKEVRESWRKCLAAVAPDVGWSAYLHWRRRYKARGGPGWERLLDERLPPPPANRVRDDVRLAACMLRRADRSMNTETARTHLVAQFGDEGSVSDASLRRFWGEASLGYVGGAGEVRAIGEEVVHYNGGGGLALVAAADVELGASLGLSKAALAAATVRVASQGEVEPHDEWQGERDELGRFTATYNARWRALAVPGQADARWAGDEEKRRHRALGDLATLKNRPDKLAAKLLCMGVTPLVTELRGFCGLDGPTGGWLGAMGIHAYMPATLDKSLTELGLLGVEQALWEDHARRWVEVSRRWSEPGPTWMQWAIYVDATQDPYWTRHFARSAKVSRVGRVMPCLSRIAISSGAGVALVAATYAGAAPLKKHLLPLLRQLDGYLGVGGEVGRLTVVDSEVGTAGLMWALHDEAERIFITVVKGPVLAGAEIEPQGPWQAYRQRDELREVRVGLSGKGAPEGGIEVRGVQMRRPDSRRPVTTLFVTNGTPEEIPTEDVATAYLARWPLGEQIFRDSRNGGGWNRSHGYGGEHVAHVALDTKLEHAERRAARAKEAAGKAEATRQTLADEVRQRKDPVARTAVALADKELRRSQTAARTAAAQLDQLRSMPREIYARDTGRDSLMTCLKMSALMLIEFVLKEYFGSLGMEWRTFISHFVPLPLTVRTTHQVIRYQLHANPRRPELMEHLREACAEITRRRLRSGKQRLVFELLDAAATGS